MITRAEFFRYARGGLVVGYERKLPDVSHLPPECLTNNQLIDRIDKTCPAPSGASRILEEVSDE